MKKFVIISVAFVSLFMVGCGKKEEKKEAGKTPQEIAMENYASDYYMRFMNKYLTNPTVSIEALKQTNQEEYTSYDLTDLEKCTDTSYTEIVLDETTNEIKGYVHHLDCK